jgi:hypothetical protein
MKNNLKKEINEIKYLFDYQRGIIISEQKKENFSEQDVFEPEVEPDVKPNVKPFDPDRERRERDPNKLPYTDPDTHPQGSDDDFDGDNALEKLIIKYLRSK